jgi:O-antigen ligase
VTFASLAGIAVLLVLLGGMRVQSFLLAGAALAPVGVYVALKRPLDFPLGLYILLVPFDNLLGTGSFGTLTKLLGIVAGICLLIWVVRRGSTRVDLPGAVLLVLMLWMAASGLWALDQMAALKILGTYAGLMLLYIVLAMVPLSPAQFRILLVLIVAGGLSAALYGIRLFHQDPTITHASPAMMRLIIRAGEYKIDPNHFADALLFPTAILMMWALRSRRIFVKLASLAGTAILVVAILYSGSREGLIAVVIIGGYYLWRSRHRLQMLIAAGILALSVAASPTSIWIRFSAAAATGGSGRTSIWAVGAEAAKHRFLQGYGVGNFTEAFDLFYLGVHQPYPYGWDSPAHNLALHYLVELGVVGLGLIVAFFYLQFRSLRSIDTKSEFYDYRVMMEASLIAVAAVSMTIDLFTYKYAWLVFSMVALLRNAWLYSQCKPPIRAVSSSIMQARSARFSTLALPRSPMRRSAALSRSES